MEEPCWHWENSVATKGKSERAPLGFQVIRFVEHDQDRAVKVRLVGGHEACLYSEISLPVLNITKTSTHVTSRVALYKLREDFSQGCADAIFLHLAESVVKDSIGFVVSWCQPARANPVKKLTRCVYSMFSTCTRLEPLEVGCLTSL